MKQTGRQMKTTNQFPGPHNLNSRFPGPSGGPVMSPCSGSCNMHSSGLCSTPRPPSSWSSNCGGTNLMPSVSNDLGQQTWSAQQFPPGSSTSALNSRFPVPQGMGIRQMGPSGSPLVSCMNNSNPNVNGNSFQNPNLTPMQLNQGPGGPLTGVKVPDENLTPQQRQHREEQLAMIRKMQQLLFPEQQHMEPVQGGMAPNMGPMLSGMPAQHNSHPRFGSGDMCIHPGMDACFSPHQSCMNEHEHPHPPSDMYMGNSMIGPGFSQQNFPGSSVSAQMEWQKLKHQFYEERCKKQVCGNVPLPHSLVEPEIQQTSVPQVQPMQTQQSMSQPQTPQQQTINSPSPSVGLSPGTRMQGPPPPYHQTNRRTMPSPHPASPNTSSLSLPSPHMASGLSSPADPSKQFPIPTPPGPRLPHPSPGPTTPVGSNSLHTTPLNSPKPLSTSGSASNSGTLIKTPTTPSNAASTPTSTPTSSCNASALCNSGPGTPASSCTSNRKQNQSCNSDIQDSNSVGSTTTLSTEFGSCPMSSSNNTQGELFCHSMHACSQASKPESCTGHAGICPKEPSLMPVPSPQQIQYLNAFDGQELTIQKQPNTSIRDLDIMSPASIPPSIVMSAGSHSQYQSPEAVSFPNTPGSCPSVLENSQDSLSSRFPISAPASMDGNMTRFTASSPQMPTFDSGPRHMIPPLAGNDNGISRFSGAANLEMRMSAPGSINSNPLDDGSGGRFSGSGPQGVFGSGTPNNVNIMPRFPNGTSDSVHRFRGPSPHASMDMIHSRFMGPGAHMSCVENISQSSQLNNIGPDSVSHMSQQSFPSSVQTMTSSNGPCVGNNFMVDGNLPHSHLQNLQKMTPPFESMSGNKISPDVISPLGQCSNSSANGANLNMASFDGTNSVASTSQVGPSQRLTHFDPIASMAAMSESTVPLVSASGNAQNSQNMIGSNMNMQGSTGNSNQPNMINFHSNIQSMQNTSACSMSNQRPQYSAHNQIHNTGCGTQAVNNTYVSTTMSMQPLNMQNAVTTAYNLNAQDPSMNTHTIHVGCQGNGANTISCSVTTNHPIMHTAVTTRTNSNIGIPGPRHGPQNFPGQPNVQRAVSPAGAGSPTMMVRGTPFNSTNVHVKAGAPNTIQYLPARQQNATPVPGRGLEFLQRYAAPLTNLDNKVPTHNLQYFPNSGGSHPGVVYGGMNTNSPNVAPNMMNNPRPVNMMMGPMMRGTSPNASLSGGQIFPGPIGAGLPNVESGMFVRPPCPTVNNQLIPMNAMGAGSSVGMFPNKQMPLPMGGMAPDTTQPLPPSMGQSFNYKQSPFYGPTTADPNYAVQFHNFQQQLYATNTKGSQMNLQNNMTGPGFFGAK
ncbi:UNVERIFIED_CONTAM: lgs [Trichonephila clavipes]